LERELEKRKTALERGRQDQTAARNKDLERIDKLEGRLRKKDEVIAELLTEHIALKKEFGDL